MFKQLVRSAWVIAPAATISVNSVATSRAALVPFPVSGGGTGNGYELVLDTTNDHDGASRGRHGRWALGHHHLGERAIVRRIAALRRERADGQLLDRLHAASARRTASRGIPGSRSHTPTLPPASRTTIRPTRTTARSTGRKPRPSQGFPAAEAGTTRRRPTSAPGHSHPIFRVPGSSSRSKAPAAETAVAVMAAETAAATVVGTAAATGAASPAAGVAATTRRPRSRSPRPCSRRRSECWRPAGRHADAASERLERPNQDARTTSSFGLFVFAGITDEAQNPFSRDLHRLEHRLGLVHRLFVLAGRDGVGDDAGAGLDVVTRRSARRSCAGRCRCPCCRRSRGSRRRRRRGRGGWAPARR